MLHIMSQMPLQTWLEKMPLNFVRLFVNSCLEETKDEILLKYNDSDRFASYDIQERNKLESVCTQYMSEKFIPKDVLQQVVCIIESCLNRINPVFVVHNFINKILDCTDVGKQYLQNLKPEKLHVAGLFVRSLRHTHSYFNPLNESRKFWNTSNHIWKMPYQWEANLRRWHDQNCRNYGRSLPTAQEFFFVDAMLERIWLWADDRCQILSLPGGTLILMHQSTANHLSSVSTHYANGRIVHDVRPPEPHDWGGGLFGDSDKLTVRRVLTRRSSFVSRLVVAWVTMLTGAPNKVRGTMA